MEGRLNHNWKITDHNRAWESNAQVAAGGGDQARASSQALRTTELADWRSKAVPRDQKSKVEPVGHRSMAETKKKKGDHCDTKGMEGQGTAEGLKSVDQ